jgi:hypothetical protein
LPANSDVTSTASLQLRPSSVDLRRKTFEARPASFQA